MDNTTLTLTIGLGLLIFGSVYSFLVVASPPSEGNTWIYVCVGVAVTLGGVTAFTDLVIESGGDYWQLILAPWAGFALTGVPIIIGQLIKVYADVKRNSSIIVRGHRDHARIHRG